jgi:hypothetical protein
MTEVWNQQDPATTTAGSHGRRPTTTPRWPRSARRGSRPRSIPGAFFRLIPRHGGTGAAFLYYLVIGMLVAGASLFWSTVGPGPASARDRVAELGVEVAPLTSFLLTPLILMIGLG